MELYPKLETLYDRDPKTFIVIPGKLRMPEFRLVTSWRITEKIDGTNIRVGFNYDPTLPPYVQFGGRTDNAQIPGYLLDYLRRTFTASVMQATFDRADDKGAYPDVTLFGEGYGPKIQSGGSYRTDVSFRLFDVKVGPWWLEPDAVLDVAQKLNVQIAPDIGMISHLPASADDLYGILGEGSITALEDGGSGCRSEGVVARTVPLLLNRRGERLMWKLKFKDFRV